MTKTYLCPNDSPARKTFERLMRACEKRGIRHSMDESRGVHDPIFVRFWPKDHCYRLLAIMPTGDLVQRCSTDDLRMTDPHALACYERWFWQELAGAAAARRQGMYDIAFRRIDTARRLRRMHARELAGRVPDLLEAA